MLGNLITNMAKACVAGWVLWRAETKTELIVQKIFPGEEPLWRSGRGRIEQGGPSEHDEDLPVPHLAQQEVLEQSAHWRRLALCAKG